MLGLFTRRRLLCALAWLLARARSKNTQRLARFDECPTLHTMANKQEVSQGWKHCTLLRACCFSIVAEFSILKFLKNYIKERTAQFNRLLPDGVRKRPLFCSSRHQCFLQDWWWLGERNFCSWSTIVRKLGVSILTNQQRAVTMTYLTGKTEYIFFREQALAKLDVIFYRWEWF